MTDLKQKLIDKAQVRFLNGDVAEFSTILKNLYNSHITCGCFLKDQPKALWESLLNKARTIKDNTEDFDLNFAKGFIYLKNQNEQEAYRYFSTAIELKPFYDVCYSLRATFENSINSEKLNDAKEAVLLNPNARNYFILANSYDDKSPKNAITYFEKVISLNNEFACAYNNMGVCYQSLKDYQNAVSSYLKCIEIEKNHWCYYNLWFCLNAVKDYGRALHFIQEGHEKHPNNFRYYFALGFANERKDKYKKAIEFYNLYLSHYPNNETAKNNLEIVKITNELLEKAISEFSQNNFENSHNNFKKYLSLGKELPYDDLIIYYKTILKCNNSNIKFGKLNSHFIRLNSLSESYTDKVSKGEPVTEYEDETNTFMTYQSDYKIEFGNYVGSTIQEVINIDSHFILWCIINLPNFSISPYLFLEENIKNESEYLEALEINIAKIDLLDMWTEEDDYQEDYPNYEQWLEDEFGDDAGTAYWNMD